MAAGSVSQQKNSIDSFMLEIWPCSTTGNLMRFINGKKNCIELVGITAVTRSISSVNKKYRGGSGWVVLGEEEGERERHLGKKGIRQHFP